MAIWNTQQRMFVHILARTNIGGNMVRIYAPTLCTTFLPQPFSIVRIRSRIGVEQLRFLVIVS